jgi:general stress protein 26
MKPNLSILLIVILFFLSQQTFSQNKTVTDSDIKLVAKEIMNSGITCALITVDKDGAPRARTMDPFSVGDDFIVWLGTNSQSRKVQQIKDNPRVTLYYLNKESSGYVVIDGVASLVNDQKSKDAYWKESWKSFYSETRENYLLIKVTPNWMEILSPPNMIFNDPITWQPPIIVFDSID